MRARALGLDLAAKHGEWLEDHAALGAEAHAFAKTAAAKAGAAEFGAGEHVVGAGDIQDVGDFIRQDDVGDGADGGELAHGHGFFQPGILLLLNLMLESLGCLLPLLGAAGEEVHGLIKHDLIDDEEAADAEDEGVDAEAEGEGGSTPLHPFLLNEGDEEGDLPFRSRSCPLEQAGVLERRLCRFLSASVFLRVAGFGRAGDLGLRFGVALGCRCFLSDDGLGLRFGFCSDLLGRDSTRSGSGAASSGMNVSSVGTTRGVLRRMTLRLRAAGQGAWPEWGRAMAPGTRAPWRSPAHSSRDERGASGAGSSAGGSGSAGAMRDCLRCWAICFQSWALAARASSSSPPAVGRCWN